MLRSFRPSSRREKFTFRGTVSALLLSSALPSSLTLLSPSLAHAQRSSSPTTAPTEPSASGAAPDAKPVVVAPELDHYEPPVYPPEAFAQRLEANVRLLITIEEDGSVTSPEVVEPVGHGFDEAALAAAVLLRFKPATVNGVARKVRIGFEYAFTPEQAAPAEGTNTEAPPTEAPRFGNLSGTLYLADSDSPLPGVPVVATDALGGRYRVTTDSRGQFSFEGLSAGSYVVHVESEGFVAIDSKEDVVGGEQVELVYRMKVAKEPSSGELEVLVEAELPPREVTRRTLMRREIERIPGTSGDALRSIQSLPGVARPPGLAGLLIVRGSAPQSTETFIDGTNVPLIYHFGGLSSVVPTELLDRLDFYPGNFSVRYGRLTGGVVDAGLRSPNTDCYGDYGEVTGKKGCYHGMAQVDLIDGRVLLQGPVFDSKEWSVAIAGRRSWIDTWLKPVLESAGSSVTSAPVYYDYQVIVDRNLGPGDKLSIRLFGSDDRFETIITSPSANDPGFGGSLRFGTSFVRGQILYQKTLSEKASLNAMVSVGGQNIDFGLGGNLALEIRTIPILLRSELGYQVHKTTRVNVGLDFLGGPFDVFVRAPPPTRPGEASPGPFATRPPLETQASGYSFRPGWYTDVEWQPTNRLRVVPGIRLDHALDTKNPDVSPRLNARYSLVLPEDEFWGGKPLKTVIKGGIGKFSEPPQFQETDPVFGSPGLRSNQSMHYSVGVEQGLTEQIDLSVEGFYKDLYGFVSRAPDALGNYAYGNQGGGRVVGLEALLKYRADDRFFGWVAYTLSESLRKDCATCQEYLFQYDQTHNLIILGSYRLGGGWEVGARFRIVSGPLVTPTLGAPNLPSLYSGDAGSYVPLQSTPFSERLPVFHQLDMRIDKRWQFRSWRLNAYIDVQNVYNNTTPEAYVYNYDYSQRAYQTGLPIIPSIGLRGEF